MGAFLAIGFAAALSGSSSFASHRESPQQECAPPKGVSQDTLRNTATRLHPEVLAPTNRDSSVLVGLVFDSECRLQLHAFGHRKTNKTGVDSALAMLFPKEQVSPWNVSGFSAAGDNEPRSPWIVWAVLKPKKVSQ